MSFFPVLPPSGYRLYLYTIYIANICFDSDVAFVPAIDQYIAMAEKFVSVMAVAQLFCDCARSR